MTLQLQGIDVHYGPVQALRGIDMEVREGEIVALVGANGAGKTTTLRTISGLLSPSRGSVLLDGAQISGEPAHRVILKGIAHLPEGRELFPQLTILENLRLGHWSRRKEKARFEERLEQAFDMFPRLRERAHQHAETMSGGEQQMLAVARALISQPRILLVDELSLGLAPIIVTQLFEALAHVNRQGTAIVLVEQFVHMALRYSSRVYVLGRGSVVAEGLSSEMLASPELMAAYLGEDASTGHSRDPAPKRRRKRADAATDNG